MAGFLKKIREKIRDITLAPGARDPYDENYYEEDAYEYDDDGYDGDYDYNEDPDPVHVHYSSPSGGRERDRGYDRSRDSDRERGSSRRSAASSASASYSAYASSRASSRATESSRPSNVYSLNPHSSTGASSPASSVPKQQAETIIVRPKVIDDAVEIGNHIRGGRMCIVDLTNLPATEAQRIADYLGGVSLAVEGQIIRVNNGIFAVAPQNHRVMSDFREENAAYGSGSLFKRAASDR